jgi:hypothetical protein
MLRVLFSDLNAVLNKQIPITASEVSQVAMNPQAVLNMIQDATEDENLWFTDAGRQPHKKFRCRISGNEFQIRRKIMTMDSDGAVWVLRGRIEVEQTGSTIHLWIQPQDGLFTLYAIKMFFWKLIGMAGVPIVIIALVSSQATLAQAGIFLGALILWRILTTVLYEPLFQVPQEEVQILKTFFFGLFPNIGEHPSRPISNL